MGAGLCAFLVGPIQSTIARVASGEFDRVPEVNDAFLELAGYSREDLLAGRLHWPDLTPPECAPLDELAHEEGVKIPWNRPAAPRSSKSSASISSECRARTAGW